MQGQAGGEIHRKQDVFCLGEARLKGKQKETLNICIAFPRAEQLCGVVSPEATHYS